MWHGSARAAYWLDGRWPLLAKRVYPVRSVLDSPETYFKPLFVVTAMLAMAVCSACESQTRLHAIPPYVEDGFDPGAIVTHEQCRKCHQEQVQVLEQHPHFQSGRSFHRRPDAIAMAKRMGDSSVKRSSSCMRCHYTPQQVGGRNKAVAGVSCESCHGPAKEWLFAHNDYGGIEVTKELESPAHKQLRIAGVIGQGMRHPSHPYALARSCVRCHVVDDERLVNLGGHPTRSTAFEFVAWSQGSMRHNFFRSDGKENVPSAIERRRVMLVVGLLADLESTLRAIAKAEQRDRFAVEHAKAAFALRTRLAAVAKQTRIPQLATAARLAEEAKLSLGNGPQLKATADELGQLAWDLSVTLDGRSLVGVDEWLPTDAQIVGTPSLTVP
jgi:hypothetical protein